MAYACNSSYSGGRDKEDQGLKPALGKQFEDPILKTPIWKMAGRVAQVVRVPA
jgi:hypothetical protein